MDDRLRACTGNCRYRPDGDRFYVLHDLIRSGRGWPAGDPGRIQSRLYANPTKHAGVRYRYRPNPERNRRIHHSILGPLEQWPNLHESYAAVQYVRERLSASSRFWLDIQSGVSQWLQLWPHCRGVSGGILPCLLRWRRRHPGLGICVYTGRWKPSTRRSIWRPETYWLNQHVQHPQSSLLHRLASAVNTRDVSGPLSARAGGDRRDRLGKYNRERLRTHQHIRHQHPGHKRRLFHLRWSRLPSGQCVLIQINSYTYGSVTGYEPYFRAPPPLSFLGTPGELRTTQ